MRPERILELATLAVARRAGVPKAAAERLPGLRERVVWLKMPLLAVSATEIRERVRRGEPIGGDGAAGGGGVYPRAGAVPGGRASGRQG